MRIALLHFLDKENQKHSSILRKLEQAAVANGHTVDIFSSVLDAGNIRLSGYEYIAVIIPGQNLFSSNLPERFSEVLASCGLLSGKKSCALVIKKGFMSNKVCQKLMKRMENEGMVLDYFDVVESVDHAAYVGKKIG